MGKKILFILGAFATMAISLGSVFKILHLPGATVLLTGGIISLTLILMPIIIRTFWTSGNKPMLVSLGTGLAITGLSTVFKILHLQGANVILLVGMGILTFLFIPQLFITMYKKSLNPK